jgi:hypothetical protein
MVEAAGVGLLTRFEPIQVIEKGTRTEPRMPTFGRAEVRRRYTDKNESPAIQPGLSITLRCSSGP